jgi:ABC-type lipoprotein release transport system permease subunit
VDGLRRPLAAVMGARYALAGTRGSSRSVGRSALVGAAAALAGVVAILTLDTGLATAQRHVELAGVTWDANVMPAPAEVGPGGVAPELLATVRRDPDVAAVTTVGRASLQVGDLGVPTFMVQPDGHGAAMELVTLEGRRPIVPGEVVLGPSTERDLGAKIGDDVTLAAGRTFRVVGTGLFPADVHAQFDEGAWVVPEDWYGLAQGELGGGNDLVAVAVRFASPDHAEAKIAALGALVGGGAEAVGPVDVPEELVNLHQVRALPAVLAAFLAFVGVAAVAYGLFSSVRRRRRDFAVLAALGVTRRGAGLIVAAQAIVVAVVGAAVGVPAGLVVGRTGWRAIAERVPLVFRSPVHLGTVVVVVPLALVGGLLLAAWPARRAARIRAAAVLRAE